MRENLLRFLQTLEQSLPPATGSHHSITACRHGNDATGWQDELGLHLRLRDKDGIDYTQTFFLDDEDFQRPMDQVIAAIIECAEGRCKGHPDK